jgi:hypothetical protein
VTRIRGTALAAGTSRNGRHYTPQVIAQAVTDAQPAITAGTLLMRAGHDSPDVGGIAGRVTRLEMAPDGQSATFEAELLDTAAGRDAQVLTGGPQPHVGVSIVGAWNGPVRKETIGGQRVETADGLTLHGLDLTGSPGIPAARITPEAYRRAGLITESAPPAQLLPDEGPDLTGMTRAQLRRHTAAAMLTPVPTAAPADGLTHTIADNIRSNHAALISRQRVIWGLDGGDRA